MENEFYRLYKDQVMPALQKAHGTEFAQVYLTGGL